MSQDENEKFSVFDELPEHLKDFLETQVAYYKLAAAEMVGKSISKAATIVLLSLFATLFLLFASISSAIAIGDALGSMALGFLIVSGFYLLLCTILFAFKDRWITTPIINRIIHNMTKKEDIDYEAGPDHRS
jgi:hypothetical protein